MKPIKGVHCLGEGCQGPPSHLAPAFAPSPQPSPIPPSGPEGWQAQRPGPVSARQPSNSLPLRPAGTALPVASIYTHGPGPRQAGPGDGETTRPVSAEMPRRGGGGGGSGSSPAWAETGQGRSSLHTHTCLPPRRQARPPLSQGWGGPYRAPYALCARHASTYGICATGALSGAAPALTTLRRIRKEH